MSEKILNTRIVHKHDTEENWLKATSFAPKNGELIIYDEDENHSYKRVKIGDGTTNVNTLPFIDTVTDQTYSPTSTNAQSGLAVAEVISTKVSVRIDGTKLIIE